MEKRLVAAFLSFALVGLGLMAPAPAAPSPGPLDCAKKSFPTNTGSAIEMKFRVCTGMVLTKDGSSRLDADVTMPLTGRGPFPLILINHGLGGSKLSFESDNVEGDGGLFHYNNLWFAYRGYAVINYTARGWAPPQGGIGGPVLSESDCAKPLANTPTSVDAVGGPGYSGLSPVCWPQISHIKYEMRDTQYLIGRMVDGTLTESGVKAKPKVGVTGTSYGGGQTWLLTRRNVWKSPKGKTVKLGAAIPVMAWTDLADALIPNGRAGDDEIKTTSVATRELEPLGVKNEAYVELFYKAFLFATTGSSAPAYIAKWRSELNAGEPYEGNAYIEDAAHKLLTRRSAYYVPKTTDFKTPIFAIQGWADGIFPAAQALQMYDRLNDETSPQKYPMKLYLGDWGHAMTHNRADEWKYISTYVNPWFDHYIRGVGPKPPADVTTAEYTCDSVPVIAYQDSTVVQLRSANTYDFNIPSGALSTPSGDPHNDVLVPADIDPNTDDRVCRVTDTAVDSDNIATVNGPLGDDVTMMGLPTLSMHIDASDNDMYVAARLWDVDPHGTADTDDDTQTLVTRGVYRIDGADEQDVEWQLFGNTYTFPEDDVIKLELTADDSPSFRKWTGGADGTPIDVSNASISIPLVDLSDKLP